MPNMKQVECAYCKKEFLRPANKANEAVRSGWKQFCSPTCKNQSRVTGEYQPCGVCGTPVWRTPSRSKATCKSDRVFCSTSCSATYNNPRKGPRTQASRDRARAATLVYIRQQGKVPRSEIPRTCAVCGAAFQVKNPKSRTCSVACGRVLEFGSAPYSLIETTTLLTKLHLELGRTPSSKEVGRKLVSAACRFFGTWNKALGHLGIRTNTEWVVRQHIPCKDGHRADSISEKLIDDWLYESNISHDRGKRYPRDKYTCDFYLPEYDLWVEYYGLLGQSTEYTQTVAVKERLAAKYGIKLLGLAPWDLYPVLRLPEVLGAYLETL